MNLEFKLCGLTTYKAIWNKKYRPLFEPGYVAPEEDYKRVVRRRWMVLVGCLWWTVVALLAGVFGHEGTRPITLIFDI